MLTTVVTDFVSSTAMSVAALCLTFLGGVLAILASMRFNTREIVNIHLGSTKFLALREAASLLINQDVQENTKRTRLAELTGKYCDLSEMIDHYINT